MTQSIRIPLVEPGTRPELAELEAVIRAERGGEIAVLYQALLNSPPIASGWERMLTAVRNESELSAAVRELLILRVAVLNRASFEYAAHIPHARAAGVEQDKVTALASPRLDTSVFSGDEVLALAVCDHMTRDVEVPADCIAALRSRFGERGVVEIVATIAAYNMVSRFLVALNITHGHDPDDHGTQEAPR